MKTYLFVFLPERREKNETIYLDWFSHGGAGDGRSPVWKCARASQYR
jgi:hypothetical protein